MTFLSQQKKNQVYECDSSFRFVLQTILQIGKKLILQKWIEILKKR